jgi:glycosyltransferase involved in cell wall biosynthesis
MRRRSRAYLANLGRRTMCFQAGAGEGRVSAAQNLHLLAQENRNKLLEEGRRRWAGRRVLLILPVGDRSGGANIVLSESAAMAAMGVDANIFNLEGNYSLFEMSYPSPSCPVHFIKLEGLPELGRTFDAVIATANKTVAWMAPLQNLPNPPVLGYYIQDFEPYFFRPGSLKYQEAWDSYTLFRNLVRFTKTEWNRSEVARQTGAECKLVGISFDQDLFRPWREGPPPRPVRIAAMIRPITPRRQPAFTIKVLEQVSNQLGDEVEVYLFGMNPRDRRYRSIQPLFPHFLLGELQDRQLADLFNDIHLFVDFSSFQAMGLVGLEAMGCGATVIAPAGSGSESYIRNGENGLLIDTSSGASCVKAVVDLVRDRQRLASMMDRAFRDVTPFSNYQAAFSILETLFPEG